MISWLIGWWSVGDQLIGLMWWFFPIQKPADGHNVNVICLLYLRCVFSNDHSLAINEHSLAINEHSLAINDHSYIHSQCVHVMPVDQTCPWRKEVQSNDLNPEAARKHNRWTRNPPAMSSQTGDGFQPYSTAWSAGIFDTITMQNRTNAKRNFKVMLSEIVS